MARLVRQIVGLVDDEQQRPFGLAQILGDLEVHRVDARLDIHDEQQHVAIGDGLLHLRPNRAAHRVRRSRDQPAGVDQPEPPAVPLCGREMTVAGDAGLRVDDRLAPPDDAIEQGRLADVGATDDGDGRYGRSDGRTVGLTHSENASRPTVRPSDSPTSIASAKSYDNRIGMGN